MFQLRIKLLCILLLFGVTGFSQGNLKYPTLLWKISGNGIKKEGYLYGTMHVSNRVAYHLSDQFFGALKSADVVGLETNPSEWLNNMELTGELSKASGVGLYNPYGGNFYKIVFGMRFPDKQVYKSILSFDPEIINGLLYRHSMSQENFEENTYIDLFIFQAASKLNKTIVSLEDFKMAEIQARLASLPDSEFDSDSKEGDDYLNYNRYGNAVKIEDAYRDGNLDALDSLTRIGESKNMQKYLLHARNVYFVHNIDSILRSGKSLFSGVGAAHLPGTNGVIEMLRRMNYKVEPVYPKDTKKAAKEQDAIDKMIKPVSFEKNFATDSLFSVQVPGKLTQIMNFDNIKYFINADMVNGNFYNIARLKTNAALNNYNVSKMTVMLDSLFFENIPGKIISKKEIENNGVKGFDIVNRTRRGDFQRYHIFVTDLELILFKLGGKGDFVNSSAGKQFFNSIKFEKKNTSTTLFEPLTKGFKVQIPNEYNYSRNDYVGVSGLVEDLSAYDKKDNLFCGVKHAIYNDFYYLEEDTFELNRLAKYTLKNFQFTSQISTEIRTEQNLPCIRFTGYNKYDKKFLGKIFIKGIHYYLAFAIDESKLNYEHPFFTSFTLTDFHYVNEIKEITDKDLYFKTKDETSNTLSGKFNEAYMKAYTAIKDSMKVKKKIEANFDYISNTKNYYSPSSHEYVEIFYEKYNDYDFRHKKDLIKKVNQNLGELLTMKIQPIKETDENGLYTYEFYMKDTATVRAIRVKVFIKNGTIYQVKVPLDTLNGLKGWANEFFSNFKLVDTIIGKDIFTYKFTNLLNDLVSTDTALQRKANYSLINSISMEKDYLNDFVTFMSSDKFNLLSSESKAQLLVNGGVFESDKIIDAYKKLYTQYSDSAYLQICVLKGLAYCRTKNAFMAISELLQKETPLVGDKEMVENVFRVMQDSLELCKYLYPGILKITRSNEYHDPIYRTLSLLVKNKLVTPQQILLNKADIIADANDELRRYNASVQSKAKSNSTSISNNLLEETIELIKANLETMATSAAIKNKKQKDRVNLNKQPLLINFAFILSPYYKTDEKAKQFIDKLNKIKTEQISLPLYVLLRTQAIILNDTLASYFSKNVNTRAYFYGELEKEGLTKIYDTTYAHQKSINESILRSYDQVTAYANYEREKSKDSLVFVKKMRAKNKYEGGELYIYKTIKAKKGLDRWSAVFIPTSTGNKITANVQVFKMSEIYNEDLDQDEIVNEIADEFSANYRNRIISGNQANYYDYQE